MSDYSGYPAWYRELQAEAEKKEAEIGWPDGRQEAWRRTDLKRLDLETKYTNPPTPASFQRKTPLNLQAPSPESKHMSLSHLADAVRGDYPGVKELFEAQFKAGDNRFIYRLLSEAPRGFYTYLPRNYTASNLLFLEDNLNGEGGETFTLNLIVLEEGARADIWERIGSGDGSTLHNRSTLVLQQRDSSLNYYRTQTLSSESALVDFSRVILKQGAQFKGYQAEKELPFNKSHFTAELTEKHSQAELRGIYQISSDNFCEIFTEQIHTAPRCSSRSFYRGVLRERARTVFNGMINVSEDASQTDAYLTNNNLLMNDGCRADSIPGLKIATNDVKCSHGSTTGKVDKNQLFYLQSRGFSAEEAKTILTRAFLEAVGEDLPHEVEQELEDHWGWVKEVISV